MATPKKRKVTAQDASAFQNGLYARLQGDYNAMNPGANSAARRGGMDYSAKTYAAKYNKPKTQTKTDRKKEEDEELLKELRARGIKGFKYDDLQEGQGKGRQAAMDALRADKESEELGEKRPENRSFLLKALDQISRPLYGMTQGVDQQQEEYYQNRFEGDGKLESYFKSLDNFGEGFKDGLTLKKKGFASSVIQNVADNQKANREGVGAANSVKGSAKVNPFLKHGLGFTLDVFADPLTYTGVGAVTKAAQAGKILKGEQVAEGLIKTAEVRKRVFESGAKISPAELDKMIGVGRAPVEQIKRLNPKTQAILQANPEAKALYETIRAERKIGPTFKRLGAGETKHYGTKITTDAAPTAVIKMGGLNAKGNGKRLEKAANDTLARELAVAPALHASLKAGTGANRAGHAAWSTRSTGELMLDPKTFGDRKKMLKEIADEVPGWGAIPVKTPEDYVRRTVLHEMGHHVAYNLPKSVEDDIMAFVRQAGDGKTRKHIHEGISHYAAKNEREMMAEAWVAWRSLGKKANPLAQEIGKRMEAAVKTAPVAPVMAATEAIDDVARRAALAQATKGADQALAAGLITAKEAAQKIGSETKRLESELAADLLAAMTRNLSPTVSRQLKVRFGNQSVGVAGTENFGKMINKARQVKTVDKAVDTFNRSFRASAKLNPALGLLRNQEAGQASARVRSQLIAHQRVWDPISKADRKAVLKDWQTATPNGSAIAGGIDPISGPVANAVEHFNTRIRGIQDTINQLGITPSEFGSWLHDPKLKINNNSAPGWSITAKGKPEVKPQNRKVAEEWLINMLKNNDTLDDPGVLLFSMHAALEQTLGKRAVVQSAVQHFGVPVGDVLVKGTTNVAKTLGAQGYRTVDLPGAGSTLFHPDIADGLMKINSIMNDRVTMANWLRAIDQGNMLFKSVVTRYNPSFHVRTVASEMMLGYIGGIRNPATAYKGATRVMRGRNRELLNPGAVAPAVRGTDDRTLIEAANTLAPAYDGARMGSGEGAKAAMRFHDKTLTNDQVWGLYKSSGLKTGFATTDVGRNMDVNRKGNAVTKVNDKLQNRFEDVEDWGRLAHFMDILKHTKIKDLDEAVADASQTVLKYHLDYTAVTQLEKSLMTRVAPFYKWVRLSTPMILESLAANPGKAMVPLKVIRNASELGGFETDGYGIAPGGADNMVPSWMRDAGALPMFNTFGNNQFFNGAQTIPLQGLLAEGNLIQGAEQDRSTIQNTVASGFSKATPFIRIPGELGLDKSAFGADPSDQGMKKYFASQAPQFNAAGRISGQTGDSDRSKIEQILHFLTNPGFQPNTAARMEGEAQQERDKALTHRKLLKEKLGIVD